MMQKLNVGILLFPEVEVLDFAGPYEVFSRTRLTPGVESRRSEESAPFRVFTVCKTKEMVRTVGNLLVAPHYSFADAPAIDILVLPGGIGTRAAIQDDETLAWVRRISLSAKETTSVCTGALLLAKCGLLRGRRATTHWGAYELLQSLDPTIEVDRNARVVHDGIFTSGGVAAGIEMAFAVVEHLFGRAVSEETARYIEYRLPASVLSAIPTST